jgi:hypothetical protein
MNNQQKQTYNRDSFTHGKEIGAGSYASVWKKDFFFID